MSEGIMSREAIINQLRSLPAVDDLLRRDVVRCSELPGGLATDVVRGLVAEIRGQVQLGRAAPSSPEWDALLVDAIGQASRRLLIPVINATGVILHTNLGRAPLSDVALAAMNAVAAGYSNLEYEVDCGERGSRYSHGAALLAQLTGASAAMVVNNGAAAILLALSALAAGREVIISRGEMIEIGGSFRIPEIVALSGCHLVEVGATNQTHLRDYEQAITGRTEVLLKVHPSNYRISGFTSTVTRHELSALAKERGLTLIEDLGSGVLIDTDSFGLDHEPKVQAALAGGVDLVTCSGDKLLGGPQAGLVLGRQDLVERCKQHPLARAVRVGKLTLAALQATLLQYLEGKARAQIPIWRMCSLSVESITERAQALTEHVRSTTGGRVMVTTSPGESTIGGGSMPGETLPTVLVVVSGKGRYGPESLAKRLRQQQPPVIGRIEGGKLLLDLRTVDPADDRRLCTALQAALSGE